jgi:hypothetical protein
VSLLVVKLRAAHNWLRTQSDSRPVLSLRIVNVLGYEIGLETSFHGSSSYPTRPAPRRVAGCRTHALHELTGADNADAEADARMPDARTGHRATDTGATDTRALDTGHRTADGGHRTRGRADAYRTPDTGHADADGGRGQGDQDTVGIRTSWYHDTAGTANYVAVAAHAALGNHDGATVRPPATERDYLLHCQADAGSLRRRPSGASAHCCPRMIASRE